MTLLELMVAMVIGGMALAGAGTLVAALSDRAVAIDRAATRVDHDANAERLLRALFANLDLEGDTTKPALTGDTRTLRFRSWCDAPLDRLERCTVGLMLVQDSGHSVLRLEETTAVTQVVELRRGFRTGTFSYLISAEHMGTWTGSWSGLVPPPAVAIIMDGDTLLLRVLGSG